MKEQETRKIQEIRKQIQIAPDFSPAGKTKEQKTRIRKQERFKKQEDKFK